MKKRLYKYVLRCLVGLFLCCAAFWAYYKLSGLGWSYEWHWNRAWRSLGRWTEHGFEPGPLLEGVWLTIAIAVLGLVLAVLIGLALCMARLSPWPVCQTFSKVMVSVLRNTPLLLQLFFVYFLLSPVFGFGPFGAALFALSFFEATYMAELFRAAVLSVSRRQWEAGLSLGLSVRQSFLLIILPQAFRNALPAFTNQTIALLKDTSLVSAIAVADLTMRAQAVVAETFLAFEVWLLAGLLYLVMALCLSLPSLWLERRLSWK